MKLRVELDLTPQELGELTQNNQLLWQKLQAQFWQQVSEQMMKYNPMMAGMMGGKEPEKGKK